MNVLFLTTHVNTGGITSYLLTLGEGLVKAGHKVLVASSGGDCVSRFEASGIRHVGINIRTKSEAHPKLLLALPSLDRLVQDEHIQIIHAQTRVTQVLGHWLALSRRVPMVSTCHGFFKPRLFRRIFPCWGKAVIAISKPVARHLDKDLGVDPQKIHLIANGIDLEHFIMTDAPKRLQLRQKWNISSRKVIGVIARLSDVKGISVLINALPLVLKEIPSATLLIAGQGPEETNLKKITRDLSLTDHVRFEDTIGQTTDLLPVFDVFVMPSLMEGLGLSVIEAQACGIPVVASRVGGLVDLIDEGASGYLVNSRDPSALARRIIDVLKDPDGAHIMALQARSNIEQHFSAKRMVKQTLELYEQYSRC